MYRDLKLSLVLPCYNEEKGVETVLRTAPECVDEVVVVDNNCTDRTAEVARDYKARVVSQVIQGYGASYKKGFDAASGDVIITLDADGTYPIDDIPLYVDILDSDKLDFITVQRVAQSKRTTAAKWRLLGNYTLNAATHLLFGVKLKDSQSGMWVFRKSILDDIHLTSDGMALSEEIKIRAFTNPRLKCTELSGTYKNVRVGFSKLNVVDDGLHNLAFLFKMRLRTNGHVSNNTCAQRSSESSEVR